MPEGDWPRDAGQCVHSQKGRAGVSIQGQKCLARPAALPTHARRPPVGMVRKYKSGSKCRTSCANEVGGTELELLQSLGRSPLLADGWGQVRGPGVFGEVSLLSPGRVGGGWQEAWGRKWAEQELRLNAGVPPLPAGRWPLREAGWEEAERLTLVGGQRGAVAIEVSGDAAAGGT